MEHIVIAILEESLRLKNTFIKNNLELIITTAQKMTASLHSGHKIMLAGNGGSAADAQHLAAEFVNRFQIERPPLAALALTTDTSVLTSIANDYAYTDIFSKQVAALGQKNDILIAISTSGNSPNILKAVMTAKEIGIKTIGFSGAGSGLADCVDFNFAVMSKTTARIQEIHIMLGHILCDLIERELFE